MTRPVGVAGAPPPPSLRDITARGGYGVVLELHAALLELVDAAEDTWDAYVLCAIEDDDAAFRQRFGRAMDRAWDVVRSAALAERSQT